MCARERARERVRCRVVCIECSAVGWCTAESAVEDTHRLLNHPSQPSREQRESVRDSESERERGSAQLSGGVQLRQLSKTRTHFSATPTQIVCCRESESVCERESVCEGESESENECSAVEDTHRLLNHPPTDRALAHRAGTLAAHLLSGLAFRGSCLGLKVQGLGPRHTSRTPF